MRKTRTKWRSPCPLNASLEMLGDRWSLLIIRDMMMRDARTYADLLRCPEKIATNILADRLRKLQVHGIVSVRRDASDRRKLNYVLTAKGIDLAPVLAEMVIWAGTHEHTGNQPLVRELKANKDQIVTQVRKRWEAEKKSAGC
jgi:DNA-binding HxlR family transcriptional regulator